METTPPKIVVNQQGGRSGKIIGTSSLLTLFVPIIALATAVLSGSLLFLDFVHVMTGATWTGVDLFMGLVMSRVLRGVDPEARTQIIKRLVPIMLFFVPAVASVSITAGIYLAARLGLAFFSTPIIIAGVIVTILSIQGFGLILPAEVRIFLELRKTNPDRNKVMKLGIRNTYLSGIQSVFQITLIFVMAFLAVA